MPATMTEKRKHAGGRPRRKEPVKQFSVNMSKSLYDSLERYLDSLDPKPTRNAVIRSALRDYLAQRGFDPEDA